MASTPWHWLTSSASLQPRDWPQAVSGIAYGDVGDNLSVVVKCCVQPTSAADGLVYGRDTTTQMYDVFLAPTDSNGDAWDCSPKDTITISSVVYRIEGKPQDMCTLGVLKKLVISKDLN